MLGTASTQQLFASATSIGVVPQIWAEWNYNSFISPAFVTSGSGTDIVPSTFTTSSVGWSAQNATIGLSSDVRNADAFSSSSAISIITSPSVSTTSGITGTATSASLSVSPSSYYKLVFYTKVGSLRYTDGTPNMISGSTITATATSTSSPSAIYYYRIIPVGSNGQNPGIDFSNNLDVKSVRASMTTNVNLSWSPVANANSYKIYRSNSIGNIMYLTTTASTSYTDQNPTVNKSSFIENNSFNGKINFTATISNATNQYCKIFETETGNPITTQNSIASNMERWQKVEITFSTPASTSSTNINFNISAEHLNAELLLTDFHLYEISSFDFVNSEIYPVESAFLPNRPGEALLHPLLPSSDKKVTANGVGITYSKPISFITKSSSNFYTSLYPTYQQVASYDDKFKYYVTTTNKIKKGIQAFYDTFLSINKIVLKIDNSISIPSTLSIKIGQGSTPTFTTVSVNSSNISDNGIVVLYYNGTSWSTSSWTSPPQLTTNGKLQNVFASVTSIQILDDGVNYSAGKFAAVPDYALRVIEFSPRLEIDLSNYIQSLNIKKDLSSQQGVGLPFSYINSNSGTIEFSNIPSIQSNSVYGQTTFENDTKSSTFSGLLRQGVKFTGMLKPSSYENSLKETVPLFVMYSDGWSINDLDVATVDLFDITKLFFMGSESMWFFQKDTSAFRVITGLLDYSGFSDYDYSALANLPEINSQVSGFWTDEKKTVFTNLQEFLIPQQIGAYIDEYGMLRFKSLSQAFNKYNSSTFSPDFAITDFPVTNIGSSSSTYIANIVQDTFSETINQKIGGIVVNYKTPLVFQSAYIGSGKNIAKTLFNPDVKVTEAKQQVWEEKNNAALSQFFINNSIGISDNKIKIVVGTVDDEGKPDIEGSFSTAKRLFSNYSADLIINDEIIGYDGLEYKFFDVSNQNYVLTRTIRQQSDIADAISDYKLYASATISSSIQYQPTGYMMNVVRGKYGTTPKSQTIYTDISSVPMKSFALAPGSITLSNNSIGSGGADLKYGRLCLSSNSSGSTTIAINPDPNIHNFFVATVKINDYGGQKIKNYSLLKDKSKTITIDAYNAKTSTAKKLYSANMGSTFSGDMEFGILFNSSSNTTTSMSGTYLINFKQKLSNTGTANDYTLSFQRIESTGKITIIKDSLKPSGIDKLFDGEIHTIAAAVYNDRLYIKIDSEKTEFYILGITPSIFNKSCGVYIKNNQDANKMLYLHEFYSQYKIDIDANTAFLDKYFFTSKSFLDSIINKTVYTKPDYFLYQQPIVARGLNFYDIKMESAPVIVSEGIEIKKASYREVNTDDGTLSSVDPVDVTYSSNVGSAFNRRFALAHNGPLSQGLIVLAAPGYNGSTSTADSTSSNLKLLGKNMILSDQKVITRILDKNYLQNTINISTDWVKDSNQVQRMITNISRANSGFHIDYSARIFGNPLIQVGDFGQITYRLKRLGNDPNNANIKPIVCLVMSVQQSFRDGLENTTLSLKPMITT